MNHSKKKSSDMLYLLGQLGGKEIVVTLHSGKCFSGMLLLDHIVRDHTLFNNLNWWRNCGDNSPVIHLQYIWGKREKFDSVQPSEDREYWILVSEIACLEYKQNEQ